MSDPISILSKILEWPIIVQGALGSALFWLILFLGQRAASSLFGGISKFSRTLKREGLYRKYSHTKWLRKMDRRHETLTLCIYHSASHMIKAVLFLGLGVVLGEFIPLLSVVGLVGFLLYLFRALLWVRPLGVEGRESHEKVWGKVRDLEIALFGHPSKDTLVELNKAVPPEDNS